MSYMTIDAIDEDGIPIEVLVDADDLPGFGAEFTEAGRTYTRVPSTTRFHVTRTSHVKAFDRPRQSAAIKLGLTPAPHYDAKGIAHFQSRREIDEYVAAVNDNPKEGVKLAWNPDGNE